MTLSSSNDVVKRIKCSLRKRSQATQSSTDRGAREKRLTQAFDGCVETGFQLATLRGPLCAEPIEGMAYFLESLHCDMDLAFSENGELVDHIKGAGLTVFLSSKQNAPSDWILDYCRSRRLQKWPSGLESSPHACYVFLRYPSIK